MGTAAVGFALAVVATFGGGIPAAIFGFILIWPVLLFKIVFQQLITGNSGETPYLLYAVVQYVGYLFLLFVYRAYKENKAGRADNK